MNEFTDEPNLLSVKPVSVYYQSSGTTGKSKLIPGSPLTSVQLQEGFYP